MPKYDVVKIDDVYSFLRVKTTKDFYGAINKLKGHAQFLISKEFKPETLEEEKIQVLDHTIQTIESLLNMNYSLSSAGFPALPKKIQNLSDSDDDSVEFPDSMVLYIENILRVLLDEINKAIIDYDKSDLFHFADIVFENCERLREIEKPNPILPLHKDSAAVHHVAPKSGFVAPPRADSNKSASSGGKTDLGLSEEQLAECTAEIEAKKEIYEKGNHRDGIPPAVWTKWNEMLKDPSNKFAKTYINKVLSVPGWVRSGGGPWTKEVTVVEKALDLDEHGQIQHDKDGNVKIAEVERRIVPFDEYDSFKYISPEEAEKKLILAMAIAKQSGLEGPDIEDFFKYIIELRQSELASLSGVSVDKVGSVRLDTDKRQAICLDGPPGTGKTSIAKIAAEILGIGYYEKTVAGQRGGHFVYGRGSEWESPELGLVAQAMANSGRRQVLILSDEAEKATDTDLQMAYGDVLESNAKSYKDALLGCDFYKPTALHLLTTNKYELLAEHIQSRVTYKRIGGYTPEIKRKIALNKLKSKIDRKKELGEHCSFILPLKAGPEVPDDPIFDTSGICGDPSFDAVDYIISNYSVEQGVRELGAMIDTVFQKASSDWLLKRVEAKSKGLEDSDEIVVIDEAYIKNILGEPHPEILRMQELSIQYSDLKQTYNTLHSTIHRKVDRDDIEEAIQNGTVDDLMNRVLSGDDGQEILSNISDFFAKQKELRTLLPEYIDVMQKRVNQCKEGSEQKRLALAELDDARKFLENGINSIPLLARLAVQSPHFNKSSVADLEAILSADLIEKERVARLERAKMQEERRLHQDLIERMSTSGGLLDDVELDEPDGDEELKSLIAKLTEEAQSADGVARLEALRKLHKAVSIAKGRDVDVPEDIFSALGLETGSSDDLLAALRDSVNSAAKVAVHEREARSAAQSAEIAKLQASLAALKRVDSGDKSLASDKTPPVVPPSATADRLRRAADRRDSTPSTISSDEARVSSDRHGRGRPDTKPTVKRKSGGGRHSHSSPRSVMTDLEEHSPLADEPGVAGTFDFTTASSSYSSSRRFSSSPAIISYDLSSIVQKRMNFASEGGTKPEVLGMTDTPKSHSLSESWNTIVDKTEAFLDNANKNKLGTDPWARNAHEVYKDWAVTEKDDNSFTSTYRDGEHEAKIKYVKQEETIRAKTSLDGFADPEVADKAIAQMLEVAARVYLETGKQKVKLNGLQDRPDLAIKFMEAAARLAKDDIKLQLEFDRPTMDAVLDSSNTKAKAKLESISDIEPGGRDILDYSLGDHGYGIASPAANVKRRVDRTRR